MIALLAVLLAQAAPARVLTLEEAQRVAQERQPQLRAARGSRQAAEGRVEQSRSGLLPQLSATADYRRTTTNFIFSPSGIPRTGQTTNWSSVSFFDSGVTLSQLLWDFGQTSNRWRSTQATARATADQERSTGLQVVLQVRVAFFNAVAFKELLAVARETLSNQRNHLVQIQGFVQEGTRPPIDLSQARADFANAEVQVINADNAYQRSKVLLNQTMGVEGPIDYDVANQALPPQAGEDGALDPLLAIALAARPEIASATEQVKAQQLLIQSARGAYAPSISAGASIVQATETGTNYVGWNAAAGVTLTWNLFQGGLTKGTVHEAEGNLGFAAAQLDVLRQQVRVDVDQALLAIRAAKAALSSSRDALIAARQRLSLAEGRYQNGSGSVIELGDAQIAAANAAAQVVQTDFQLATARAQLLWALGRA
ncbi:MAG: TolC family protein [Deltaproteobacteria bacterium]|nr:MAG: TolC family protein [Deltaproteobacteria bacterium]